MLGKKILKSINLAINLLEEAMDAHIEKQGERMEQKVWKAAAEVEYASFLLSLKRESKDDSWKDKWRKINPVEIGQALLAAQDCLKEALNMDLEQAYRKTWIARGYILVVQEKLNRKREKK